MGTLVVVPHRGDDYDIQPMKVMGDLGQINFAVPASQPGEALGSLCRGSICGTMRRLWSVSSIRMW